MEIQLAFFISHWSFGNSVGIGHWSLVIGH